MRWIVVLLFILTFTTQKAHSQPIPYASTPCPGCTTESQEAAAAQQFVAIWVGSTPPGSSESIQSGNCNLPRPGGFTTTVVASTTTSLVSTFWVCFRLNQAGNTVFVPELIATSNDPCYVATNIAKVPCTANTTNNSNFFTSQTMTISSPTLPYQGNTSATVHSQFPIVMQWIFQNSTATQLNTQMSIIDDIQLAHFSQQLWTATNGNPSAIMQLAAQKLSPSNLARWAAAFDLAATTAAVSTYAPGTLAAFKAQPIHAIIPQSHAQYKSLGRISMTINALPTGAPAPNINMTLGEIYDEYLWNGAETAVEALARTSWFAGAALSSAFVTGYKIGTKFYGFAESIDPNYGYDLVTTYGDSASQDFGSITGVLSGTGSINDGDIIVLTDWCVGVCEP
jgi:hypothetical protein